MSLRSKRSQTRGFILLDAMVAFAVLSILLVAVYTITTRSFSQQAEGYRIHEETLLARALLDEYVTTYPSMTRSGTYMRQWAWSVHEETEQALIPTETDHLFRFIRITVEVVPVGAQRDPTTLSQVIALKAVAR